MNLVPLSLPAALIAFLLASRVAGAASLPGSRLGGCWRAISFAALAYVLAGVVRLAAPDSAGVIDLPAVLVTYEAWKLLSFALLAGGLAYVSYPRSESNRLRWQLEVGLVVVGASALLPDSFLTGAIAGGGRVELPLFWLRSLQNVFLLLGMTVILREQWERPRGLRIMVLAALGAELTRHLLPEAQAAIELPAAVTPGEVSSLIAWSLLGGGALLQLAAPRNRRAEKLGDERSIKLNGLTYLALTVIVALVLANSFRRFDSAHTSLAVGLAALTFGLLLRQLFLERELAQAPGVVSDNAYRDRLQCLLSYSSDLMLILNPDGTIRYLSPSVRRVLGHEDDVIWTPSFLEFVHPEDMPGLRRVLTQAGKDISGVPLRSEWRMHDQRGAWVHVEGVITNHVNDSGIDGLLLNVRDVSERKALERKLVHQALHDPLTNLANRTLLLDRIEHALSRARRQEEEVALLFLDLDDFKQVNDTLGHAEGDKLLKEIAMRLQASCRASDTIARLGGDEFAVLIEQEASERTAQDVAERILRQLRTPYLAAKGKVMPSTSVGIATVGPDVKPQELVRRADVAMYQAKALGKDKVCVFEPMMDQPLQRRARLESDLRDAVRSWQLTLYYQPIVSLETGSIVGVEALIRWPHPELGMLLPEEFLHLAHKAGLNKTICRKVLLESCLEVSSWNAFTEGGGLFLCVNVFGEQVADAELVGYVKESLTSSQLPPQQLVLEMSERSLLEQDGIVRENLQTLEALGVRVAIDDFGTEYSSLSYLKNLPVHLIKLDKSFVSEIGTDGRSRHIVKAVSQLAEDLGIHVIAEGIESGEQHEQVTELKCDFGQGFYYLAPRPCYELRDYLRGESSSALYMQYERAVLPARAGAEDEPVGKPVLQAIKLEQMPEPAKGDEELLSIPFEQDLGTAH